MLFTVSVVSSVHHQSPAAAKLKSDEAVAFAAAAPLTASVVFVVVV
jgi:hypothetical protein